VSTYAIGDIQGCFDELEQLLTLFNFDPTTDDLWFVGDLINRGPKNLETLNFIMSLERTRVVLGNHDLHFLAVASGARTQSRSDTLDDLIRSDQLPEIIEWMRHLPLIYSDANWVMVHAGIPSIWDVEKAATHAREVESTLSGNHFMEFFKHMYGNSPAIWDDNLTSWDRLRVITNYLTRLRYCTASGEMNLTAKDKIQPPGYSPWFSFPRRDSKQILFGHWAAIGGTTGQKNIIALDTGCVWGRELTALRLDDRRFFSVSAVKRNS
jgi:bis(5'-nucleosyl)-tetraphosphatase (symmetrical)|tara:strand:- start:21 stop:821 length:801 start_codon:yes stop_codon:yes gene_type:complete